MLSKPLMPQPAAAWLREAAAIEDPTARQWAIDQVIEKIQLHYPEVFREANAEDAPQGEILGSRGRADTQIER